MSIAKKKMRESLIEWVVPFLKTTGFKGFFPHYVRIKDRQADLLTFQFTYFDEAFCVNLAKCPRMGIQLSTGTIIPPEEVRAMYCRQKLILGADGQGSYHWFKYNPRPAEFKNKDRYPFLTMYPESLLRYKHIADDICRMIKIQGEEWWGQSLPNEGIKERNNLYYENLTLLH